MSHLSFSKELKSLLDKNQEDPILISSLLEGLGLRTHGLLIFLLSLPFVFPLPLIGLSTLFGIMIMFTAVSLVTGWKLWMPRKIRSRGISRATLEKMVLAAEKVAKKGEYLIRPRWRAFSASHFWTRVHGVVILMAALVLALPLPPGGNILPGFACLILAVGLIEEDGFILALGYLLTLINVILILLLFLYGLDWLKEIL